MFSVWVSDSAGRRVDLIPRDCVYLFNLSERSLKDWLIVLFFLYLTFSKNWRGGYSLGKKKKNCKRTSPFHLSQKISVKIDTIYVENLGRKHLKDSSLGSKGFDKIPCVNQTHTEQGTEKSMHMFRAEWVFRKDLWRSEAFTPDWYLGSVHTRSES